jgi:hypothetical protein
VIIEFTASETQICLTCHGVYMSSPSPQSAVRMSPQIHPIYGHVCVCPVAAFVDRAAVFLRLLGSTFWLVAFEEWGELPEGFHWTDPHPDFKRI